MWSELYKVWKLATSSDPLAQKTGDQNIKGAGYTVPDVIPDIRSDGMYGSGGGSRTGIVRLRETTDYVDLTTIINRQQRYKEYDRLKVVPEIETALNIYSNECCVSGNTKVATPWGMIPIRDLAETYTNPEERFLVYCYNFEKGENDLGWGYNPRLVKKAPTVNILLSDGSELSCTEDHRVLLASGEWRCAGDIKQKDKLMAFHRIKPLPSGFLKRRKGVNRVPSIFTQKRGWLNERMLLNEFRSGIPIETDEKLTEINIALKLKSDLKLICKLTGYPLEKIMSIFYKRRLPIRQIKYLYKNYTDEKEVYYIYKGNPQDVYDLSVHKHENFATDSAIVHNCQDNEEGNLLTINVSDPDVKEELTHLFFNHDSININNCLWKWTKQLLTFGDFFIELVIDPENPDLGILSVQDLPPDTMYRIETIKGKLIEFQQSKTGPDEVALGRVDPLSATESELLQGTAIRFAPESIVHFRIGDERREFYPYGVSIVDNAKNPANTLRLCEDCMLVYRLSRAPERRVFYVDIGNLPFFKAQEAIARVRDQLKKRKTTNNKAAGGINNIEERYSAPSPDEDFWIPTRANSNTRVETLPGASNLDQIDDCLYFRNKLFIALNIPKQFFSTEDTQVSSKTVSSLDVRFSRIVERIQKDIATGLTQVAHRHLRLIGYPKKLYKDLSIKLTPPSFVRETSLREVMEYRANLAQSLLSSGIYSHYDVLTRVLKHPPEEAKEIVARVLVGKLQELKLQVYASNPKLLGIAVPQPPQNEMGTESGGQTPDDFMSGVGEPGTETPPPEEGQTTANPKTTLIPEPDEDDIEKYNMTIDNKENPDTEELEFD